MVFYVFVFLIVFFFEMLFISVLLFLFYFLCFRLKIIENFFTTVEDGDLLKWSVNLRCFCMPRLRCTGLFFVTNSYSYGSIVSKIIVWVRRTIKNRMIVTHLALWGVQDFYQTWPQLMGDLVLCSLCSYNFAKTRTRSWNKVLASPQLPKAPTKIQVSVCCVG